MPFLLYLQTHLFSHLLAIFDQALRHLTQPARSSLLLGTAADLPLTRAQLMAENALLHHQLVVLRRQVKKPHLTRRDRLWFLPLATRVMDEKAIRSHSLELGAIMRPCGSHGAGRSAAERK